MRLCLTNVAALLFISFTNGFVRETYRVPPAPPPHGNHPLFVSYPPAYQRSGASRASPSNYDQFSWGFPGNGTELAVSVPFYRQPPQGNNVWAAQTAALYPPPPRREMIQLPSLKNIGGTWLASYMKMLKERPLATKAVSSAVIQAAGDILSQFLFARMTGKPLVYDSCRTLTFMLTGFCFNAPMLHKWYNFVARFGKRLQRKNNIADSHRIGAELVLDQSLGVALFYPLYFFAFELCSCLAYGRAPNLAAVTANGGIGNIIAAIKAQYALWPVMQLISFRFVPESLRVIHTNMVSLVWNIFFCSIVTR